VPPRGVVGGVQTGSTFYQRLDDQELLEHPSSNHKLIKVKNTREVLYEGVRELTVKVQKVE
jgi:hypothetical protein